MEAPPKPDAMAPSAWARADSLPQRAALTIGSCVLLMVLPFGPNRFWLAGLVLVVQIISTVLIRARRPPHVDELGMYLVVEHSLMTVGAIIAPAGYVAISIVSIAALGVNSPYQPKRWQRPVTVIALIGFIVPVVIGGVTAGGFALGASLMMVAHITLNRSGSLIDAEQVANAAQREANLDSLTGLSNRRVLRASLVDVDTSGEQVSLALLDLDNFKEINDTLGHDVGDQLLCAVASRLASLDPELDVVRLGGDEFAVLVPGPSERMNSYIARLEQRLADPMIIGDVPISVRASIGLAHSTEVPADQLLRSADIAMYRTKGSGAGPMWFRQEDNPHSERRMMLLQDLPTALENGDVRPWFQPQVSLSTGSIVGVEALARWHHPTFGVVGAGELLAQVDLAGLQPLMTRAILRQAVDRATEWPAHLGLSVNVTLGCVASPGFVPMLEHVLDASGFAPGRLTLEVVETSAPGSESDLTESIAQIRDVGILVSLDDFGQAASSLARLDVVDADELKIDRWFISRMIEHRRDRAIVDSIVDLARRLNLRVVAEGVETEEVAQAVADAGIDVVQGYLYARPTEHLVVADYPPTLPKLATSMATAQ